MKINLKARLKNKTFIISAAALIVSFAYKALSLFDIVPSPINKPINRFLPSFLNLLFITINVCFIYDLILVVEPL